MQDENVARAAGRWLGNRGGCFWIVALGAAFVGWATLWPAPDEPPPAPDNRPIIAMTVAQFQKSWAGNELAAKRQWATNRLQLSGKVESVTTNMTGSPILHMAAPDPTLPMVAHFTNPDSEPLADLAVGQDVSVLCSKPAIVMGIPAAIDCTVLSGLPSGPQKQ